ncbi:MAG: GNAT family N-acetyltransferase [Planctomycetales bacterium]|nr:GNAT family N-acetyltransferase [Planctomycetales bacterium]
MNEAEVPQLVIRPAGPQQAPELLGWLLDERLVGKAVAEPGRVFAAFRSDRPVGAIWAKLSAGRIGSLIGPRTEASDGVEIGCRLIRQASDFFVGQGVTLAQASLPIGAEPQIDMYRTAGFGAGITLDYLVSSLEQPVGRAGEARHPGLGFVPYRTALADSWQHVLLQTYEGSLDCPLLNGRRAVEDILAGYRAVGAYADPLWLLIQFAGRYIGCLILTDHPADDQLELIYLGIVPEFRGRGFGLAATRHAQGLTRRAGRSRLILAVDSTNGPAQAIYGRAGFICWDRRQVVLRFF